jgi:hypothetical protein
VRGFYKNKLQGDIIMLNVISQKFHAWTTGWRVLFLFLLDVLMMGYIMPVASGILALAANNSVLPLDLLFFYTPRKPLPCWKSMARQVVRFT